MEDKTCDQTLRSDQSSVKPRTLVKMKIFNKNQRRSAKLSTVPSRLRNERLKDTMTGMSSEKNVNADKQLTMRVVNHIQKLIESGALKAGDKIAPEREFATQLKISRASLRAGIGYLAAMGVLNVRHGVGTFVAEGEPASHTFSMHLLSVLHGFTPNQMFEARLILESSLAALAAERGGDEHFAVMSEEVTEMYATFDEPQDYLIHDVRFHRAIAEAAGNPILAVLMETVATAVYDERRRTVEQSLDLRQSAEMHRAIYRAIRTRDAAAARKTMEQHLRLAQSAQGSERTARPRVNKGLRKTSTEGIQRVQESNSR
jgi:GntR family transcriptional regulator, transcriptional repressor for pyruvate dehydrogenase complex